MKTSTKNRNDGRATTARGAARAVKRREKLDSRIINKSLDDLTVEETAWLSNNSGGLIDAHGSLNLEAIKRSQSVSKQTAIYRIGGGSPVLLVVSQSDLTPGVVRDALEHLSKCQMRFESFDAIAQMPASQVAAVNASSLIIVFYEPLASCLSTGAEAVIWNRSGFPDAALSTLAPHILKRVADSLKDDDVALVHDTIDDDTSSDDHQTNQESQTRATVTADIESEERAEQTDDNANPVTTSVQVGNQVESEGQTFAEDDMYEFTSTHPSPPPEAYDVSYYGGGEASHQAHSRGNGTMGSRTSDSARSRSSRDML